MNDNNNEKELPLGLYWKGKRTTVDHIVLPFQSLEVVETINESRAIFANNRSRSSFLFS